MSPADGVDFPGRASGDAVLADTQVIVLHGGRALVLFEGVASRPPRHGKLVQPSSAQPWTAECWRAASDGSWCGLAVLASLPLPGAVLHDADTSAEWHLDAPARFDITPQPLLDLARRAGLDSRAVFDFLVRHLLEGGQKDSTETRDHSAFARTFLTSAAERDGFIEILGTPDCGGLYAQGWSLSLPSGPVALASVASDLTARDVHVAHFAREDILPPGQGFCFFGGLWHDYSLGSVDAVFFEKDGRLLRLDVLRGATLQLQTETAALHVARMLPRMSAPDDSLRAFKRICRPRFPGTDTLSATALPVAAAFDAVLQAPDGALLAIGWVLDPENRVERVLIKSSANLYAALDPDWVRLPRPDLNRGFAADPRFVNLLDDREVLHGFLGYAPARIDQTDCAEVYVELVLDDDTCLFRPLTIVPLASAERLPQILAALSPGEPELPRITREHLTPFLTSVQPTARAARRGAATRPVALGTPSPTRTVAAIMPFRRPSDLQPILGLLGSAPEAGELDLVLVTSRDVAADGLERIEAAFHFYGLHGSLVVASDHETTVGRFDVGVATTSAAQILCWMPSALPKARGWLAQLRAEAASLPVPGLISPALTYEDGSICFDGGRPGSASTRHGEFSGYGPAWLRRGDPEPVASGAAEIALVDRALIDRAGGFAGRHFSDSFAHLDLAARLRRVGAATWRSGAVEFWMLDDEYDAAPPPFTRLMQQVDAILLERRETDLPGDRT